MREQDLRKLEKRILGKMNKIKNREVSPKDSEIAKDLNLLKRLDEPSYEEMLEKYKEVLEEYKAGA
jgi:uncharacterized protein YPO0396